MSSAGEKPTGQLFTHVYLDRSVPLSDSAPFRRRLGGFCSHFGELLSKGSGSSHAHGLSQYVKQETGFTVPNLTGYTYDFEALFVSVSIENLLNLITLIWRFLATNVREYDRNGQLTSLRAKKWLEFVRRALKEENLRYTVDDAGGVHYLVDEEFERNRVSALQCLQSNRYAGARTAFDAVFGYLDANPPDTKAAVRSIFEAVEIVAKLMTGTQRLNRQLVEKELTDLAVSVYAKDPVAADVVKGLFAGFASWVNAVHYYRHGQGKPEPVAPPIDVALFVISSGAAFLRWLATIDRTIASRAK